MSWLGWAGDACLAVALVLLGLLSRRLGAVTKAPPYYIGLLVAGGFLATSAFAQFANAALVTPADQQLAWALIYEGLPAFGMTVGLVFAWRYWSWLLAERD